MRDSIRNKMFNYFEDDGERCRSCLFMYYERDTNWGTCILADEDGDETDCPALSEILNQ